MELLRIKDILKEKGMSSKTLAERVEVTPASISNIANNNHFPKPELLVKIAEALDVDVRDLFTPTKETDAKPIYIQKNGKFINIGNLNINE